MKEYSAKQFSIEAVCLIVNTQGTTFSTGPASRVNVWAFFQQAVKDAVQSVTIVENSVDCERTVTVEMKMLHSYTRNDSAIVPTTSVDYQVLILWTIARDDHTSVKLAIPSRRLDTYYSTLLPARYFSTTAIREVIYDGLDRSLPWLLCSLENPTCEIPDLTKDVEKMDISNAEMISKVERLRAIGEPESVTRIGSWQLW
ncbi:MAG: hypothetical protein F9K24_21480 [Leptonema illini]|uniref:Uncharacterized protein n=1 Tax=Leptonema illini TaxID=183 RepID=A0A833GX43_9LEPT|nr:MAG: hypothetical protein F9K24_21480 [Leptonema illini]